MNLSIAALAFTFFATFVVQTHAETAKIIKVGVSPVLSSAAIFIAEKKGYFKKAGLNLELLTFDSSGAAMTPLLGKGELDVGAGNISSGLLNAINEGVDIKIVADKGHTPEGPGYMALLVRSEHLKSGRYKTLKDLKGFKVGLTSLGGVSQQILFEKFLAKAGLKAADVEYLKMSYPEMNVAFDKNELDAAIQLEPYVAQAVRRNLAKKVADASEVYPGQQSGVLIYSASFAARKTESTAFMSAYLKGVRDYNNAFVAKVPKGRSEITSLLNERLRLEPPEIWNDVGAVGLNADGHLNVMLLQNDLAWYLEKKYIKSLPATSRFIDANIAENAFHALESEAQ